MTEKTQKERHFDRQVAAARYWLLGMAEHDARYFKVIEAMEFAKAHHNGRRGGGGPEFMHQIEIFHKLRTLYKSLVNPTVVFILGFLHDVVEDGQKQPNGTKVFVGLDEIERRFGIEIAGKVAKLSKEILGNKNPDYSLDTIFTDIDCAPTKLADRDNNISTMMGVFKRERALRYVKETVEEFLPRAKDARRNFPEQEAVFENLKSSLNSQLALIELMMPTYQVEHVNVEVKVNKPIEHVDVEIKIAKQPAKIGVIGSYASADCIVGHTDGKLAVRCTEDMQHFKYVTMNQAVVMTRTTFEAIAGKATINSWAKNPLKGRKVYVLTTKDNYLSNEAEGIFVVNTSKMLGSPEGRIRDAVKNISETCNTEELWVCGGPTLYDAVRDWAVVEKFDITYFSSSSHGTTNDYFDGIAGLDTTVKCESLFFAIVHHNLAESSIMGTVTFTGTDGKNYNAERYVYTNMIQ